jgi:hypothetical protein
MNVEDTRNTIKEISTAFVEKWNLQWGHSMVLLYTKPCKSHNGRFNLTVSPRSQEMIEETLELVQRIRILFPSFVYKMYPLPT